MFETVLETEIEKHLFGLTNNFPGDLFVCAHALKKLVVFTL